ncbi:unnamed protein product [Timema podura]|uniref:Peptidase M16C associated domain-containing protein n=1 Tax=Timema podura TaxID=61482 RepID=A0ABN7NJN5_TIMPD|nr:unnamed protein product [Timema podura]
MRAIHEPDCCNPLATSRAHYQQHGTLSTVANVLQPAKTSITSPTPEASKKSSLVDLCEGKELEGFVIQQVSEIPDFHCKAYRLLHTATGAQYLHIYRNDSNNVFSMGLRTTPNDSTGLPHILEHTTLCGSVQYPCRDPFFKMLNRSMATFMNAMTGPDYTMYPFSTQNKQDYHNLMSVYLDAVLRPKLRESDFRQEGWRLEHEQVEDPTSPIILKGVVFNEMKGVFAENQSLFGQKLLNTILPSNTYGYVSGGDPLVIPKLTYKDLVAFHKKYYSPSNSRIYSYGNFPLEEHLNYINSSYLSNFEPSSYKDTSVPSEKRWQSGKSQHISCRPDPMAADPEKQSSIAISFLCSNINDIQETFELQVLSELLVKGPNSAFYKTLVEPNIGAGFSPVTGYDAHTKDTIFTVGLQGLNATDFDKVVNIFDKTVDTVIENGFEERHIEGVLHRIELSLKHQSSDFGLNLLFGLTPLWNHDGDLVKALKIGEQVLQLRQNLKINPRHLQDKVYTYLKANKHRLVLTMSPDESYESKQAQAEQQLLNSKLANLSEKDREVIYQQGIELKREQENSADTSCLPTLKIKDLNKAVEETPLVDHTFNSVPLQICVQPTNGVTYFRGILNTSKLDEDLKKLLPLFSQVVTKMGTKKHNYREVDQLAQLKTGGLNFSSHVVEDTSDLGAYEEGIIFSTYCLDRNVKDMFELWTELFNEVTLEDLKRFETLVRVSAADLVNGIVDMGHHYAISSAASLVSLSACRKELLSGLSYVTKMREIAQKTDLTPTLNQVQQISSLVLNKTHLRCATNLSPNEKDFILSKTGSFIESIPGICDKPFIQTRVLDLAHPSGVSPAIHHVHAIPVNFTAKCVTTVPYTHGHFAPLRILTRLLTSKYLHPLIREKGGAYGSGASLSPSGVLNFFSYRDPNSTSTLDAFDEAHAWVSQNEFTDQDIEEAKLGIFQKIDAPIPPGSKGMNKFLYGIDDEVLQKHRLDLMTVSREDIHEVSSDYLDRNSKSKCARALIGPENKDLKSRSGEEWKIIVQE